MQADSKDDILGAKRRNYQFLQLVREKKYAEGLILGKLILKESPDNSSVKKFVEFIQKNAKKLDDMVKEQEQYESVHSSDDSEDEEEEQEANGNQNDQAEEKSSQEKQGSDQEEQEEEEVAEQKIELTTCTLNQIPHVCPRHHKLIIQAAQEGKV